MRYLIYNCIYATPHLETEMEIATKAMEEGHEVFFLICEADLKTCFINPEHKRYLCSTCQSKVKNGLSILGIPSDRILTLSQFQFPQLNADYSFSSVSELKQFEYKGSDIGFAVASSLVSSTRDHDFDTVNYASQVTDGIKTAIKVHEIATQVLELIKPDVVIMFNGRFLESRPFMRLCQRNNIDFYTHERGGQLDRYMLRKNATPHSIAFAKAEIEDLWQHAGDEKHTIGENFYLDRRNKVVQSWSVFTEDQKEGTLPDGYDTGKKNIGFFNSSMDEYEGIPDFHNPLYDDDNVAIAKICESFLNDETYQFYLRVHPNLKGIDNAQNKAILNLTRYKNLTIIPAKAEIDTYALMEALDIVVTFGSTIGIEALFWGKPSLLLSRAFYEDLEGVIKPGTHEEAVRLLKNMPVITPGNSAIKYGYWCISFGIPFKYFKPTALFAGTFNGKKVTSSVITKIKNRLDILLTGN